MYFVMKKTWLSHLDEMTDRNANTERLIEIALYCAEMCVNQAEGYVYKRIFEAFAEEFGVILEEQERLDNLPLVLQMRRHGLTLSMREQIEAAFGENVLNQINP